MPAEARLLEVQRRFLAALREPIFGDSRARSALPPRAGEVSAAFARTAEALITPSATLAPSERLELYHRQYWYRLLDALGEDFPSLRALLGEAFFWGLLEAYLEAVPPRSYTLRHLGAGLADFIAAGTAPVPQPAHAADLARLEYALCAAFEAGDLPPVEPAALGQSALALPPHLQLLALRTPADTLWRAAEAGRRLPELRPASPGASRYVAVYRAGLALRVERLPHAAHAVLSTIRQLGSLDRALERVTAQPGLLRARDAGRVQRWFQTWTQRGWLCHPPEVASIEPPATGA